MKKISTILCLIMVCTILSACGNTDTTLSVKNAHMTTSVDSSGKAADTVTTYTGSASKLVVSAQLVNVPANTTVKYVWSYVTSGKEVKTNTVKYSETGDKNLYDSIALDDYYDISEWPDGNYKVEIYLNDSKTAAAIVAFVVKTPAPTATTKATTSTTTTTTPSTTASTSPVDIQALHMTTAVDSSGVPVDTVTTFKPSASQVVVSGGVVYAPAKTMVMFVLRYGTDNIVMTKSFVLTNETINTYIFCYFTNDKAWPTGDYAVDLYLNNDNFVTKTITFSIKD